MTKKSSKEKEPEPGIELIRLVESFCAKYKKQPLKRCVHAAAELFTHLADHGYDVVAVRTRIDVWVRGGPVFFEHAWVEVDVGGVPVVIDPTGPQQFNGPLICMKKHFLKVMAMPTKKRVALVEGKRKGDRR